MAELRDGESVRWSGMPDPSRARRGMWPVVAFGAVFAGFALFWMTMAVALTWFGADGQDPTAPTGVMRIAFPLFGVPFVAVGLGIMSVPLFLARRARTMVCCVTDRRALRVSIGRSVRVDSWMPADIGDVTKEVFADGTGSVNFVQAVARNSRGFARTVSEGFVGVPDPRGCEEALLALKDRSAGG